MVHMPQRPRARPLPGKYPSFRNLETVPSTVGMGFIKRVTQMETLFRSFVSNRTRVLLFWFRSLLDYGPGEKRTGISNEARDFTANVPVA